MGTLPDDVLLKIFKFFVDEAYSNDVASQEWCTLVHVCRRWRHLAFTSPRHLNLRLLCKTSEKSVDEMLDIWPELPIYVDITDYPSISMKNRNNIVAALRLNHRVSRIRMRSTGSRTWEIFAPLMQHPFPALTYLWVQPGYSYLNKIPCPFPWRICSLSARPPPGPSSISGITGTALIFHQPCSPLLRRRPTFWVHFSSRSDHWPLRADST